MMSCFRKLVIDTSSRRAINEVVAKLRKEYVPQRLKITRNYTKDKTYLYLYKRPEKAKIIRNVIKPYKKRTKPTIRKSGLKYKHSEGYIANVKLNQNMSLDELTTFIKDVHQLNELTAEQVKEKLLKFVSEYHGVDVRGANIKNIKITAGKHATE